MANKKLIEVALPLEKINAESAREKSIRHGHPSTLHLWWARRPLAAARAVIWASLVDDPSSHPEEFPTEEEQAKERQRLFSILEELVVWDNSNNQELLKTAKKEVIKSTNGILPVFLDPFAGGGAIPLEAQRLGLESHAHDLNPVAVMINKAMIEIPPIFANNPPVNPNDRIEKTLDTWFGAEGLAADIHYYGNLMKDELYKQVGHLYPKVKVPTGQGGGEATVIAWLWTRTVKCPNPTCKMHAPLIKSLEISKKMHAKIRPYKVSETEFSFEVGDFKDVDPKGTVNRSGGKCIWCNTPISFQYIREESKNNKLGVELMSVVAEGEKGRLYLSPDKEQILSANTDRENIFDNEELAYYPGYINPVAYGITKIHQLFSDRQITTISAFSRFISDIRNRVIQDAEKAGMKNDYIKLCDGGKSAQAYGDAIATYLAFAVDRLADRSSTLCGWDASRDGIGHTFGLTGMPMLWDYAEANPFSNSSGCFDNMINWVEKCVKNSPIADHFGHVKQMDAQSASGLSNIMVSTDPPYYSNVPYADFADFFYVWMRNSLKDIYPNVFSTLLTPKAEELVADPYRAGSKEKAAEHFEDGMLEACKQIYKSTRDDIPVTIYYAFKDSDNRGSDDETSVQKPSTGWEKMLTAIIESGFCITGTWPVRTELANRSRGLGANALASSIVLVCRKRDKDATQTTRRNLINALRRELYPALEKLQESNIAPVDLAQSAIGPGMAVFSKYSKVLEADGTPMTVRSALKIINEELDIFFNEQVGEMDSTSRFCVELYTQCAYNDIKFGDAEVLANAKGASISLMSSQGILYAKGGIVHLIERDKFSEKTNNKDNNIWMLTQQLTQAMEKGGIEACANIVFGILGSNAERAKDLAYRLYTIAEQKKWANEAYAYNSLVVAWPDIQSRAAALKSAEPEQMSLFDLDYEE